MRALQGLPQARLTEEQVAALRHGQAVPASMPPQRPQPGRRVRVYGPDGAFLGLAEVLPDGWLQPRRLIAAGRHVNLCFAGTFSVEFAPAKYRQ